MIERTRPKSGKSLVSRIGKDNKASEMMSPKSVNNRKPAISVKDSVVIESVLNKSGRETTRNQIITKIAEKDELVNIVSESGDKLYYPRV